MSYAMYLWMSACTYVRKIDQYYQVPTYIRMYVLGTKYIIPKFPAVVTVGCNCGCGCGCICDSNGVMLTFWVPSPPFSKLRVSLLFSLETRLF